MSASHLNLVDLAETEESEVYVLGSGPETRAERVRRMQANAKALAREQIEAMTEAMLEVAHMAEEIATGGDAYPVGVRELSNRIKSELEVQAKSIAVLLKRS
jgi:hypothetical protein